MNNPFDPGYFFSDELRSLGFAKVGEGTVVARNCTIIGLENIAIGDNVRIDGFTTIVAPTGSLRIGSNVHIANSCSLGARAGIEIDDYASLSQGVRLFTAIDDYSGGRMTNATLPDRVLAVEAAPIRIGRHVPIGSGTLILPGVSIGEGAAVVAHSLVNRSLEGWFIHGGNPAQALRARSRELLRFEELLKQEPLRRRSANDERRRDRSR